jgi:hypothetical protein
MIGDGSYMAGKSDPLTNLLGPEHGGRSRALSNVIGTDVEQKRGCNFTAVIFF